jgi:hypothetical protein
MTSPRIMFLYAAFLAICGLAAFALAGFDWHRAKTALIVGLATAILMSICGWLAGSFPRANAAASIGLYAGHVLALLFGAMFAWRAYETFASGVTEKRYLAVVLTIMAAGSFIALIGLLLSRGKTP